METREALAPFECRYLASFGNPPRLVELRVLSLTLEQHGLRAEEVEARLAELRGITHPYLPRVAHSGVRDGSAFYVVDAAATQSLDEYLRGQRKGRIDPERAFDMLVPVGQAVATLHRHDLIHGDLSTRAIRVEEATERTFVGTYPLANVLGMKVPPAPFRELQQTRQATRADDVRDFAALLYQALTGTHVSPEATPPPPSSRCPLPPEADEVILKALEPNPARRTTSLDEVLDGLAPLKTAIAEVAAAARSTRSRAIPAPDLDRRSGAERRAGPRSQEDLDSLPFMDKLAVWLFDRGVVLNLVVFGLIAVASFQTALLVPQPAEFMSGEFRSRAVSIASGKFDAEKIQSDLVEAAGLATARPTQPEDYEERLQALRRFAKAIPKGDRDAVFGPKAAAKIRLTYSEDRQKACAMLDLHLRRAHEYLLAQEKAKTRGAGG